MRVARFQERTSEPVDMRVLGGRLYFKTVSRIRSSENGLVWSSDGTPAGTHSIFGYSKEESEDAIRQTALRELVEGPGGKVFLDVLLRTQYVTGVQERSRLLMLSDEGKVAVPWAALALPDESSPSGPEFARVDGALFFRGLAGAQASLWKTDGARLTAEVKGINPTWLTTVGGTLFFRGQDGSGGTQLWKSDGTEAGTVPVKDVVPTALSAVGGRLFFEVRDAQGVELWTSDGTEAGTVPLKKFGTVVSSLSVRGTFVFTADDGVSGVELWKSDGTEPGTVRVKDIAPGAPGSQPSELTDVDGTLFFRAVDGTGGAGLWKSDGTEAGTVRVKELAASARPSEWLAVGRMLLFRVDDEASPELWKSDGTETGTVRVRTFQGPTDHGIWSPVYTATPGDVLFFSADDGVSGVELWKSDGTEAGTARVKDFTPGKQGTSFRRMANSTGTVLVEANGFWKSDGTEAGTVRLSDAVPSLLSAYDFQPFDKGFLVSVRRGSTCELWKTNGTEESTVRLLQLPGVKPPRPHPDDCGFSFWNLTGPVLFTTGDIRSSSWVLWRTDGTEAGTVQVLRPQGSTPGALLAMNQRATDGLVSFLTHDDAAGSLQLWRLDEVGTGMVRVKDLYPAGGVRPDRRTQPQMMAAGRKTFFVVSETLDYSSSQAVVWTTDGTEAGTVRLMALPRWYSVFNWVDVGDTLYLQATIGVSSPTPLLWKSDGTVEGTGPLRTFRPDTYLTQMVSLGGKLFFTIPDDGLWRSDGTQEGTVRVKALVPIPLISRSPKLPPIGIPRTGTADVLGEYLVFTAARSETPELQTLWISDGTEEGTVPLEEEGTGRTPRVPTDFVRVGSTLFFNAEALGEGNELWSLGLKDLPGRPHCGR